MKLNRYVLENDFSFYMFATDADTITPIGIGHTRTKQEQKKRTKYSKLLHSTVGCCSPARGMCPLQLAVCSKMTCALRSVRIMRMYFS